MGVIRSVSVWVLLILGALLVFSANIGVWVERTIFDTDTFVATADRILEDEVVRQMIAEEFSEQLIEHAEVEQRIEEGLPEGLGFVSGPVTMAVTELLTEASLRAGEIEAVRTARNEALRAVHGTLIAIIEDDSGALSTQGDELVLNLGPALQSVADDVGVAEGGLLENIELPEEAGQFAIEDKAVAWSYRILRYGRDVVTAVAIASVAALALSVAVARERRKALRNVGIVLGVVGILSLVLLLPLRQAVAQVAEDEPVAKAVVDGATEDYRIQSFVLVAGGFALAAGVALAGDSRLATTVRAPFRRGAKAAQAAEFADFVRERTAALRIGGLVGGALLLIAWPDPTARVYVTILGLLAVYLAAIAVVASDADWAVATRKRVGPVWKRYVSAPPPGVRERRRSFRVWLSEHQGLLRMAGIVIAVGLLLAWPSLTFGSFAVIVALGLFYLGGLDWLAVASSESS